MKICLSNATTLRFTGCLALVLQLVLTSCSSKDETHSNTRPDGWPEEFRIGVFAGDDVIDTTDRTEAMTEFLSKKLGIPVSQMAGTTYTTVIEAMRAKRIEAMVVGPFAHCFATKEANAEALGVTVLPKSEPAVFDASIKPYYYSLIITKKGNGINKLQNLKGRDFSFVDPASTSGHLFPKSLLIKSGLDPDNEMKTVFAGSHASSILSVWNDKVIAGATYGYAIWKLHHQGHVDFAEFPDGHYETYRTEDELKEHYQNAKEGQLVIIGQSAPIPRTPFAIRRDMPESFKQAVKEAVLAAKDHPEVVERMKRWYVDPSEDQGLDSLDRLYDGVREVATLLNLDLHNTP